MNTTISGDLGFYVSCPFLRPLLWNVCIHRLIMVLRVYINIIEFYKGWSALAYTMLRENTRDAGGVSRQTVDKAAGATTESRE